jgi:hypothetical protein
MGGVHGWCWSSMGGAMGKLAGEGGEGEGEGQGARLPGGHLGEA